MSTQESPAGAGLVTDVADLAAHVGEELGHTEWRTMTQERSTSSPTSPTTTTSSTSTPSAPHRRRLGWHDRARATSRCRCWRRSRRQLLRSPTRG